jgi:hypothetical protein
MGAEFLQLLRIVLTNFPASDFLVTPRPVSKTLNYFGIVPSENKHPKII